MADTTSPENAQDVSGNQVDALFEEAYRDLDRFIVDRFAMLNDLLAIPITGSILKSSNKAWAAGWETGFKRCLVELEKAAHKHTQSDSREAE